MVVTYPLLTVMDDLGNIVSGATVAITSVKDKAGADIVSHGATLNTSGANISVDYDAETKNEAWLVLAISKIGSTFTGPRSTPAFYLTKDSGRLISNLDAQVSTRSIFSASTPVIVETNNDKTGYSLQNGQILQIGQGIVSGSDAHSISFSGSGLIAVNGSYDNRWLYVSAGVKTTAKIPPCDSHTVTGTGNTAIHVFHYTQALVQTPTNNDTVAIL